jgi:parallel beta-helix repeat protein
MNVWARFFGFVASLALLHSAAAGENQRGATVPWTTYEAERARTNGGVFGPVYTGRSPVREASGRQCVLLSSTGQFVEFVAKSDAQGLVVRYSIPDTADGRGEDATLSLYINGKLVQKLPMTSRYAYLYGKYPFSNNPSSGAPRRFWDELHVMPGEIHAGDLIRLQKDSDDAAVQYLIDFVDLESVPAPLAQPGNALSVSDFGAKGNGQSDDRRAFVATIAAAEAKHKSVWIPAGHYLIKGAVELRDVAIQGAGMWYTALIGAEPYTPGNRVEIRGAGSNIQISDFAIIGNLTYRRDSEPNDGIVGSFGTGSVIRNIWLEHTKTGAWLTNSDGLIVENCRFRDTIADGINLCVGMRNTTVRNCTARNTGDDCFAVWPATYAKSEFTPGGNRFVNCTAQLPYLAQGFSIYGGDSNSVENCKATDIPYGAGLFASTTFRTPFGFRGVTSFRDIDITRAGDNNGAVGVVTDLIDLAGLRFENINVVDSATDGVKFISLKGHLLSDATFDHIRIVNPGMAGAGSGVVAARNAVGSATLTNIQVLNPKTIAWQDNASAFKFNRNSINSGAEVSKLPGADYSDAELFSARQ